MDGFTIDTLPDKGLLELVEPQKPREPRKKKQREETDERPKRWRKAAWADTDDDIIAVEGFPSSKFPRKVTPFTDYRSYLVSKFETIYGRPNWATRAAAKRSADEDFDVLAEAGDLITDGKRLPKTNLGFSKCTHLTKLPTIANSVQFHPDRNVTFISGMNGQIDIVNVDGDDNKKLNSVLLENFQLHRACFTTDGEDIIIGSKTTFGYFYNYNMRTSVHSRVPLLMGKDRLALKDFTLSPNGQYLASTGRKNSFYLMSMKPKEIITSFQLNDEVHSLCFSPDSTKLFAGGDEGLIYCYDVRQTKRCFHRFYDDGAISCKSLSISPNTGYFITGDQSGLVNCYKYEDVMTNQNPKPIKNFTNLKTPINSIKFNNSSELAIISSSHADNCVKLVHFPSCTIFSNFPVSFSNLRRVNAVDISPNSGYIALANNLGYAYLYRLNHFPDY